MSTRAAASAFPNLPGATSDELTPTSAHFSKFVLYRGAHFYELRKVMGISGVDLTFAADSAAGSSGECQIRNPTRILYLPVVR
jgi:hypothetical protein